MHDDGGDWWLIVLELIMHCSWWLVVLAAAIVAGVLKVRKMLHTAAFALSVPSRPEQAKVILEQSLLKDNWAKSIYLKKPDGNELAMVYATRSDSTHLILYSHGMGGALTTALGGRFYVQDRCKAFLGHGASVLCYDYSGFGASPGDHRTEKVWNQDCDTAFEFAENHLHWPRHKIIAVGQSIGSGVTMNHLSRHHGYAGVLLFHPFRSVGATKSVLLARYILRFIDIFPTETIAHLIEGPVVIVHADSDLTVPYSHGVYLKNLLQQTGQLHKFVTLKVPDPKDAHGGIFHVSPHRKAVSSLVREFVEYLRSRETKRAECHQVFEHKKRE